MTSSQFALPLLGEDFHGFYRFAGLLELIRKSIQSGDIEVQH
uniref:Uncharacterized protein n=1 Tax=mine drainage metagenome TaxID=410659 RepID=E6QQ96_9ZZZZ